MTLDYMKLVIHRLELCCILRYMQIKWVVLACQPRVVIAILIKTFLLACKTIIDMIMYKSNNFMVWVEFTTSSIVPHLNISLFVVSKWILENITVLIGCLFLWYLFRLKSISSEMYTVSISENSCNLGYL